MEYQIGSDTNPSLFSRFHLVLLGAPSGPRGAARRCFPCRLRTPRPAGGRIGGRAGRRAPPPPPRRRRLRRRPRRRQRIAAAAAVQEAVLSESLRRDPAPAGAQGPRPGGSPLRILLRENICKGFMDRTCEWVGVRKGIFWAGMDAKRSFGRGWPRSTRCPDTVNRSAGGDSDRRCAPLASPPGPWRMRRRRPATRPEVDEIPSHVRVRQRHAGYPSRHGPAIAMQPVAYGVACYLERRPHRLTLMCIGGMCGASVASSVVGFSVWSSFLNSQSGTSSTPKAALNHCRARR